MYSMPKFFEIRSVDGVREEPTPVECMEAEAAMEGSDCRKALVNNVTRFIKTVIVKINVTDLELTAMRQDPYYHQVGRRPRGAPEQKAIYNVVQNDLGY